MMRTTKIESFDYLGPYGAALSVGSIQTMVWTAGELGPYYMSPQEQQSRMYDRPADKSKKKYKTKDELVKDLIEAGVQHPQGTMVQLLKLCKERNIPSFTIVPKLDEGWMGRPKCMLQVLFEIGFVDRQKMLVTCCFCKIFIILDLNSTGTVSVEI